MNVDIKDHPGQPLSPPSRGGQLRFFGVALPILASIPPRDILMMAMLQKISRLVARTCEWLKAWDLEYDLDGGGLFIPSPRKRQYKFFSTSSDLTFFMSLQELYNVYVIFNATKR